MSIGSGGTQQQQVNIKDPWVGAAPYLSNIMQQGASLYNQGAGSQLWQGPTVAPLNSTMGEALMTTEQLARNMQNGGAAADPYQAALGAIKNSGVTGAMGQPLGVLSNVATGQNGINTGGIYGGLIDQSLNQNTGANNMLGSAAQSFGNLAGGAGGNNADIIRRLGFMAGGNPISTAGSFGNLANTAMGANSGAMGALGGLYDTSQTQNTAPRSTLGRISQGADSIGTGGQFRSVSDQAAGPTSSEANLGGIASGSLLNSNPYLSQLLDANAARIGNRVNSAMSGAGRYGSFGQADALARSINETNLPILNQNYEQERQRQLAANQQIDASRQAANSTRLAGISGETGVQGQNLSNMMNSATGLANMQNAGTALGAGLLGQSAGLNNQNITNALSALSGQTGAQAQNVGAQQNAYNLMGGLRNTNFSNAVNALQGQTGAAGGLAGSQRADVTNALGGTSGLTGVQGQNIANQTGAAGGLLGGLQNAQGQAIQYAGLAPTLNSLMYDPAQRLAASGQYQQGRSQQELDAQRQLFDQAQNMPWSQLSKYLGSVQGLGQITGQAGSTTSAGSQDNTAGLMQILQLFGGGGNTGAGSSAAGLANAGSAILGMFSDRDAKTDIKRLGVSPTTGLDIYAYRYKGDPKTYPKMVGPMAQDIEEKYPGSTGLLDDKMFVKPHAMHLLKA